MTGRRPSDLYTRRSLLIYSCCLIAGIVLVGVILLNGAEPRLAVAAFCAAAFIGLIALRPNDS